MRRHRCSTTEPAPIFAPRPTSILPRFSRPRQSSHLHEFSDDGRHQFTRTAKRHRLQNRYVVFNHPVSPTTMPVAWSSMIPRPIFLPGEYQPGTLQKPGFAEILPCAAALIPQPVTDTIGLQGMKPFRYNNGVEYLSTAGSRVRLPEYHRPQKRSFPGRRRRPLHHFADSNGRHNWR